MIQLKVKINSSMDHKLRKEFNSILWEDFIIGYYGIVDAEYIQSCTTIVFKSDESKTFFLIKYS
jgi:hypothetical protein